MKPIQAKSHLQDNTSNIPPNQQENRDFGDFDFSEMEDEICHLRTFSNLKHRKYARLLYQKIKNQISKTRNKTRILALNKLMQIIELKVNITS